MAADGAPLSIETIPPPLRNHTYQLFWIRYGEAGSTELQRVKCEQTDLYSGCASWLTRKGWHNRPYIIEFNDVDYACDAWFDFSQSVEPDDLGEHPELRVTFMPLSAK